MLATSQAVNHVQEFSLLTHLTGQEPQYLTMYLRFLQLEAGTG